MTKTMIGWLVACLIAISAWAGDDDDIVLLEANALDAYHGDLANLLSGPAGEARPVYSKGAMGADSPLPEADNRNHYLNIVHRSGYSWAENHEAVADFYVILEGSGTLLLGGDMVDSIEIDGRPGEWRSPALEGAERYELAKGDMINIPSRVPHQWELSDDEAVTYVIVKVIEPAP